MQQTKAEWEPPAESWRQTNSDKKLGADKLHPLSMGKKESNHWNNLARELPDSPCCYCFFWGGGPLIHNSPLWQNEVCARSFIISAFQAMWTPNASWWLWDDISWATCTEPFHFVSCQLTLGSGAFSSFLQYCRRRRREGHFLLFLNQRGFRVKWG